LKEKDKKRNKGKGKRNMNLLFFCLLRIFVRRFLLPVDVALAALGIIL
jgi:hypothetical protein